MFYYTYVLLCVRNGTREFYIGSTKDLRRRVSQHQTRGVQSTKRFDSVQLVYYEACLSATDARKRELQLKTGFGRGYIKRRLTYYFSPRD